MYKYAKAMPLMDMRYLNLIKQHIERQYRSETIGRKYNIRKQMKSRPSRYLLQEG